MLWIDDGVWPVSGDDPARPARSPDLGMVHEILVRPFGGGEKLDVEAVEQSARAKGLAGESLVYPIVIMIGRRRFERDLDPEEVGEDMIEPHPRGGSPEEV